jgi:hypothetical protein
MGSLLEINDTLEITVEQGFPSDIFDLSKHVAAPVTLKDVRDRIFIFHDKPDRHIYQLDPVRVFLLQNINGKWLFWGKAYIQSLTIAKTFCTDGSWEWTTSGTYKVFEVYEPEYQRVFTIRESLPGLSYF